MAENQVLQDDLDSMSVDDLLVELKMIATREDLLGLYLGILSAKPNFYVIPSDPKLGASLIGEEMPAVNHPENALNDAAMFQGYLPEDHPAMKKWIEETPSEHPAMKQFVKAVQGQGRE